MSRQADLKIGVRVKVRGTINTGFIINKKNEWNYMRILLARGHSEAEILAINWYKSKLVAFDMGYIDVVAKKDLEVILEI